MLADPCERGLAPDGSVSVRYLKQIHRYREQAPSHILIFIRSDALAQAGQIPQRRRPKQSAVFPTELRRAFIPHPIPRR